MNRPPIQLDALQSLIDSHRETFDAFTRLLIEENQKYNLTRITDQQQIYTRHFLDSLTALGLLDELAGETGKALKMIDVGSGAGFPVLALAVVRPDWSFCSLEATGKKVHFQQMACDKLGLDNVQVIHGRAEEIAHQSPFRERFDVACARAVAAMPMLTELLLGFVKPNRQAIFWKGTSAGQEAADAMVAFEQMGAEIQQILPYTLPEEPAEFSLVVCKKTKATPRQYPRPFGIIKKKPLV